MRKLLALGLATSLSTAACGDGESSDSSPVEDTGVDVGADSNTPSDVASDTDDPDPVAQPPSFEPAPAQAAAEWTQPELVWQLGTPSSDDAAAGYVQSLIFDDPYLPPLGNDGFGTNWASAAPDEDNQFPGPRRTYFVGTTITLDEPGGILVQADRAADVYLDGRPMPGDIYGNVGDRVPFAADAGEHVLIVEAFGPRGDLGLQVWTTTDELAVNTGDITRPDLIVNEIHDLYLGVPVLNTTDKVVGPIQLRVLANDYFEETIEVWPGIAPGGLANLPFRLSQIAASDDPEAEVEVTIRVEGEGLEASYDTTVTLPVSEPTETYNVTFKSDMDGSAQYYGVRRPNDYDPATDYGIVLSLHGAGVQARGQANSYAAKDWAWIVAPTNRRPFGFDWEVFGRVDGLEVLADAKERFGHDPTRVHVTGHSMGGHGTWQFGTHFPGLFATVGPSAGWDSFYTYGGSARPSGVFASAAASSDTSAFRENLANRSIYIIHGDADDNVPVSEARRWVELLTPVTDELEYHEEPGAGHWWNVDPEGGADCVDWDPMFEIMEANRLDPYETVFSYEGASPWVNATHSYVTVQSVETPLDTFTLTSTDDGGSVVLTTTNVRSMELATAELAQAGVTALTVDGESVDLTEDSVWIGPETGKNLELSGPFNHMLETQYCYVLEDNGLLAYDALAAYWSAYWAIIGNGASCTITESGITPWVQENFNLIYMGVPPQNVSWDSDASPALSGNTIDFGPETYDDVVLYWTLPSEGRLAGGVLASDGYESSLFRFVPFQSRFVLPDYMVLGDRGIEAAGFLDAEWNFDASLGL